MCIQIVLIYSYIFHATYILYQHNISSIHLFAFPSISSHQFDFYSVNK